MVDGPLGADAAADGSPDGPSDVRPISLPPGTVWTACGKMGENWPNAVVHSFDGEQLLVAYANGGFALFPAHEASFKIRQGDWVDGAPARVALSRDGGWIAFASDGSLVVVRARDRVQSLPVRFGADARVLQFSPTSADRVLVTAEAATGGNLQVWSVADSGSEVTLLRLHQFPGSPVATFGPDGNSLVGLEDGQTLVTTELDGTVRSRHRLDAPLARPVFSSDGTALAGVAADGTLVVHDTDNGSIGWMASTDGGDVERLFFLGGTGSVLALGRTRGVVYAAGKSPLAWKLAHRLLVADPAPDGSALAGVDDEGTLVRLDLPDGYAIPAPKLVSTDPPVVEDFQSLAVSRDGRFIATAEGPLVWDVDSRLMVRNSPKVGSQVEFSPAGDQIAVSGRKGASIFRPSDQTYVMPSDCLYSLVFAPDGARLACATEMMVTVIDRQGSFVIAFPTNAPQAGLRFSSDGAWLASSANEVWSTANWQRRFLALKPDPEALWTSALPFQVDDSVAFSPDGSTFLVSNSRRDLVKAPTKWVTRSQLRDARDGHSVHDFGMALPRRPSFSPDGAWIVAATELVHLPEAGMSLLDATAQVSTFLPDGRIAVASSAATINLYCPHPP
jgi:WD40 repeat protein